MRTRHPVIGIDSSFVSVALVGGVSEYDFLTYKVDMPKDPFARPLAGYRAVTRFLRQVRGHYGGHVDLVVIEAPVVAGARNIQSTIKQSMVNGALQAAVRQQKIPFELIAISSWKKEALGKGNLDKPGVKRAVRSRWPDAATRLGSDQDLFDAYSIYICALDKTTEV